jgi:hypothetical protein
MRGIRTALTAAVAAVVLAGCGVGFYTFPTSSQEATIGPVAVNLDLCVAGGEAGDECQAGPISNSGEPVQLLLAFMVPKGTSTPASFDGSPDPSDLTDLSSSPITSLTLTRSTAYTDAIQTAITPNPGEEWVGYVSQYVNYNDTGTTDQILTATPDFGLPAGKNGGAFGGPFNYQLLLGALFWDPNSSAETTPPTTTTYICGTTPADAESGQSEPASPPTGTPYDEEICVFNYWPATIGRVDPITINDAGILPGKRVTVSPGNGARLSFTFEYDGSAPHAAFKLSASTTVKHAGAHSVLSSITPHGTTSKKDTVTVNVPARTKRGTYKVTLTAKLPNGQSRTATAEIKVK